MSGEQTVLVTGATGRVGGQVIAQLAGIGGVRVRALSRDPVAAAAVLGPGVEIVGGDLAAPGTLAAALTGVDAVFLVFPSVTADGAARELVTTLTGRPRRIVYLSAYGVPDMPDSRAEPDGGIIGSHAHVEGLIAGTAREHTFPLGRSLRFEGIDATQAGAELFAGMPADVVASIITNQATMVAHPERVTDTTALLIGRPALSFAQWARDHIDDFTTPAR